MSNEDWDGEDNPEPNDTWDKAFIGILVSEDNQRGPVSIGTRVELRMIAEKVVDVFSNTGIICFDHLFLATGLEPVVKGQESVIRVKLWPRSSPGIMTESADYVMLLLSCADSAKTLPDQ